MTPFQIFAERAAECRREALASTLINVRNRWLSAAATWQEMAHAAEQSEVYRRREAQRKAELELLKR